MGQGTRSPLFRTVSDIVVRTRPHMIGHVINRGLEDARSELGHQKRNIMAVDLAANEIYDIQAEETQLLPGLASRSQTRHWRIGDRSIPWQVASQQSLPPFPPATSFQPKTPANATIGHRSMPKKIHRCVGVDRPFVSSEHGHQPESPHSGVAHLAPE